ncbi:helical backbone metal receptor [Chitinophaga rhizophila]|uniref:Helical backbone metal receptor n=1 Tax=Chitinophaga rhizophila TaxID=2866212 RepID=A0ABS7GGY8_9BACT|nr:helical backbone metal receptor [Chitinophaga rhizophila]MBW8686691.1 helical backbone metal receptor [Chitinophaga rhizophila]
MKTERIYKDQLGREVVIPFPPRRIISVVPSQTELLFDLGLADSVIGITKFCVHPAEWSTEKQQVGGTKKLHLDKIIQLQPDLVIANKEENTEEDIRYLMEHVPVWVSDIHSLAAAQEMIESIGLMTDRLEQAKQITSSISIKFSRLRNITQKGRQLRTAYFIWRQPWMVAGGETFINNLMPYCGLQNVYAGLTRYPVVEKVSLRLLECELLLLSSEPYPFKEKHIAELAEMVPGARIELVDGEMFSWYGSRLEKAAGYLEDLWKTLHNCE